MKRYRRVGRIGMVGLLAVAASAAVARADAPSVASPLRLNAFAVDLAGPGGTRTAPLDIVIDRWSTDAERDALIAALADKGSDALLGAMQKVNPSAGYIRTATSLGWPIQYAREETRPDGGRRIVFATDRPLGFYERLQHPRSADYEFMLGEIRLGSDGKGEGRLVPAAKLTFDKDANTLEIENYALEPVRLTHVETSR